MRTVLVIISCCLLVIHSTAKEKVQINTRPSWLYPIQPDLQKTPAQRDISDGYYFELLDVQVNLLRTTVYTHYIKHIINESGVQNGSEVSVNFAPSFQELIFHKITIIRDGTVFNQLQSRQIQVVQEETEAADFQYTGLKRAFVTLKDVRKGDRIEVEFSLVGFNPVFGQKYTDEFILSNNTAVCNYFRTIITSPDRKLFIQTLNDAPKPVEEQAGNTRIYHWSNLPLKYGESLSGAPSWFNNYPTVSITEYADWKGVIDWGLSIFNRYKYPLPEGLQHKIAAWRKASSGDKDQFADLATRFVQDEVRYLGLEIGPNTHQPHPPAEVFSHRFGDCKDKALLLALILQQEGIPAYVALISTTTRDKLTTSAPSPGAFDHAIVAIERSAGTYIYVDATIPYQRGSLINRYIPAYGCSLILRDGETGLRPIEPGFLNTYSIQETLDVSNYDTSRFTVSTTYAGGAADKVRDNFAEYSTKDLEDSYRKYYGGIFDGIIQTAPITTTDDSVKNEFTVNEAYAIPEIWDTSKKGKRSLNFTVKILNEYLPDPSSISTDIPLAIGYPRTITYTLRITMPETWHWSSGDLHIKNDAYQFDFHPLTNDRYITLQYFFKTFKDNIPAAAIAQYKKDYKEMTERIFFELYKNITPADGSSGSDAPATDGATSTTGDTTHHSGKLVCWPAVWLTFFFAMFFSWLWKRLNARSEDTLYPPGSGYPLGGWTIVLGITIGLGLLFQLRNFITNYYYSNHSWETLGQYGGHSLQYLSLAELVISLLCIASAGALLYWFFHRRDIFPRMFTWYAALLLCSQLLLIIGYNVIPYQASLDNFKTELTTQLIRNFIYCAVWVTYIRRSQRVKATFLEPFRGSND
jgi:transglutaminase-like putative cysteine protease